MLPVGIHQTLTILRSTSVGLYLGNDAGDEVLLPNKYVPDGVKIGETIRVFLYHDGEGRIISTTLEPKVLLNQFARLTVFSVNGFGAFMDWGLEKHLFVPYREQPGKMTPGHGYLIYLYLDEKTNRLVGSGKPEHFVSNTELSVQEGDKVDLLVWTTTDLGVKVIVNQKHIGLLYHNEVFSALRPGDYRTGYIKLIREDNKIDVTLQKPGYGHIEPSAALVLEKLEQAQGFLPLTDNSSPEAIARGLEMSKKTFKKAIGLLYKKQLIALEPEGIRLIRK